jgi:hypothetical protein
VCKALVTSKGGEILMGAVPLELLDVLVDPSRQKLIGAHGATVMYSVK